MTDSVTIVNKNIFGNTQKKLSVVPNGRDLIGHFTYEEGAFPKKNIYAVFEYPDCFRRYDGKHWIVIEKKPGENLATFEAEIEGK